MSIDHAMVPPSKCPICNYKMDCATSITSDKYKPREGDVTICIKCGELLVFGKDFVLRLPTREEYEKTSGDPRILTAQILVRGDPNKPDDLK